MSVRDTLRIFIGTLLTLAGLVSAVISVSMYFTRTDGINVSRTILLISSAVLLICSLSYIICGIITLAIRRRRKPTGSRVVVQIAVVFYIIALILSATNGILVTHLIIALISGIIVPEFFFLTIHGILSRR